MYSRITTKFQFYRDVFPLGLAVSVATVNRTDGLISLNITDTACIMGSCNPYWKLPASLWSR